MISPGGKSLLTLQVGQSVENIHIGRTTYCSDSHKSPLKTHSPLRDFSQVNHHHHAIHISGTSLCTWFWFCNLLFFFFHVDMLFKVSIEMQEEYI